MYFGTSYRYVHLSWLLLSSPIIAQGGCRGDTSIYNQNGLVVPFKNLCGKDIQKVVDFLDPTDERTWSDCLDRCVMKAPLCYGFDFTPYGTTDFSCWLMNATFSESDAKTQTYTVDAAMLSSDFLAGLPNECRTLGLQGCFQKNGQLGVSTPSVRTSSIAIPQASSQANLVTPATIVTTAITTNAGGEVSTVVLTVVTIVSTTGSTATSSPASTSNGLSTGAKAGLGAGIGAVVLIAGLAAIFCMLKRKKRKQGSDGPPPYLGANEKIVDDEPHRQGVAELQAHQYGPYGSPELAGSAPTGKTFAFAPQEQIHEIGGSARFEK